MKHNLEPAWADSAQFIPDRKPDTTTYLYALTGAERVRVTTGYGERFELDHIVVYEYANEEYSDMSIYGLPLTKGGEVHKRATTRLVYDIKVAI